ncbi:histidine kinase 5 isoform X2 [Physcomitrium patens]|uniref:histidine kinase n=1 Tax=Physcomitrium patens TaxID=3218 RepID=A0A2K1LA97_PHYPA|nr:histidine kinase 5-like isoform X2 [Physcomitrium patens]PNR62943.1 hypothetical protein PHYPA_001368 [Physcomitrium patens]|eukprot:XP_024390977.1 histidine kinase 5-like isoform X2 [Physcomitrella patens]
MASEVLYSSAKMVDVQAMPGLWPESTQAVMLDRRRRHTTDLQAAGTTGRHVVSKENTFIDSEHFKELLDRSCSADSQQASLARLYEDRQDNAVNLLKQQLETLNSARLEAERRQIQIMEESYYEPMYNVGDGSTLSEDSPRYEHFLGDDGPGSWSSIPGSDSCSVEMEGDSFGPAEYWRDRARGYAKLLTDSIRREEQLVEKLNEYASMPPPSWQPIEEIRTQLHRFDNFLRFSLRKAPVVIGHQDSDLRYRFIYNAFPTLSEEEVIGKTDIEIYSGSGVAELMDFKREVMRKGWPEKREISFNTDLFGEKTFLIAVEPVLSRSGEAMGLNYIAMDISEQVDKRERISRLREEVAVQKAMEAELHKTIHITEEAMRAKQMLATMSHEIRSPLSGVVSIAEVLATTQLDQEQRQLVDVMVSSGDLVLQLINDILDLSKVQSGAMKFEAKKFRPREVVKHVLQMALANMQSKDLILEGLIYDDVPLEVIGDVLRIRQVLTNLVGNAIKFTHEGSVTISVRVVPPPPPSVERAAKNVFQAATGISATASGHSVPSTEISSGGSRPNSSPVTSNHEAGETSGDVHATDSNSPLTSVQSIAECGELAVGEGVEDAVWLLCEVSDSGIGIPESALPTLFEKYTQVSTAHARKYGGTGLGLAICKNLVELMGGNLTVLSKENHGSTFSFALPFRVDSGRSKSSGRLSDEVYEMMTNEAKSECVNERLVSTKKIGYFHFTSKVASLSPTPSLNPSPGPSPSRSPTPPISRCRSNPLSVDALTESNFLQRTKSHGGHRLSNRRKSTKPVAIGFFHDGSPEFMDVDSKAPDHMKYIPGLSMTQCQSQAPFVHKQCMVGPSSRSHRPSTKVRLPKVQAGLARKDRMTSESSVLPHSIHGIQHQRQSRILLAEDNKVNVMVAQSMMQRLGHKLEVVNNGAEAIEAVKRNSYDVILMDVCMPVMDGLEATRRIRRYEATGSWEELKEGDMNRSTESSSFEHCSRVNFDNAQSQSSTRQRTPIIAMTANALTDNMMECYMHGMDSFVAKPVTFRKLEHVLKQFIPCLDSSQNSSGQLTSTESGS